MLTTATSATTQLVMRFKLPVFLAACAAFIALPVSQGSAQAPGKDVIITPPAPDAGLYEGGRGLITTEGPSGMFINPTSGTLPAHAATLQYCFLLPTNDFSEVMGHGALLAYGVTDFLEVGVIANYIDFDGGDDPSAVGPMVRLRLMKDTLPKHRQPAHSHNNSTNTAANRSKFSAPIRSLCCDSNSKPQI
jgi:hypothetical protein